ncbi:Scr1 family TA system antitoxin-like transcriptional regulator [Amycolatopsis japonica]|uniref:Scr1 family TA system antitoxin-like transcriptional regulator n=1 Tax=Amycolatopsis japonica TaxID=208439 RepID=UPI003793E5C1
MKSKKTPQLSTAKQRELGAELRRIRMRAGYLATDMSRMLGWPASTISRLESGLRSYQAGDIAIYLARAKATPPELDELVALDRRPDDGYQVRSHPVGFPDELPLINVLDTGSQSITTYSPNDIPRQLQIEPYIREALVRAGHEDESALDTTVHARLASQPTSLRKPGPFTFYVHQKTLDLHGQDLSLVHEQVLHLLLVSSLPNFRIHLVPPDFSVTGIRTGFTIFEHDQHRPVLHLQQLTTSLFLENDRDVSYYAGLVERIADKSLTRQQTQEWLTDRLANLERR